MAEVSPYTLEAIRILNTLDEVGKKNDHFVFPVESKRPDLVRSHLRMLAKDRDWYPRLVTSISGGMMFIRLKELSRLQVLERLVEELLLSVDDELLYDKAMKILYGGQK